ncbi:OmpA family protein [Flavobacterium sp. xlx-214]|uniref:OmpA family protein n=1 Tax=unclassified Flavobacterium TaxID=196869 RepID=UPI0013D63936|nr:MULTISPECIES: OmpA family protein [unclassified Flavobacterium]MBA5793821.1 OmpA family protein [Flavobacterium sp. xlx-221]QMI84877.1 OmpA family protein [Flavobacterium sp. xlx-214]
MKKYVLLVVFLVAFISCKNNKEDAEKPAEKVMETTEQKTASTEMQTNSSTLKNEEGSNLTGSVSNLNVNISLKADQLFDFDKAVLKPEAEVELQHVFDQINGKTESKLQIVGYTDAKGTDKYNKELSLKRAETVKNWLVAKGLKNIMAIEGKGAENPVAPNTKEDGSDNPEGRAQNRRVEIKTKTEGSI